MPDLKVLLSSQEFSKKAGVSSSTVSKWLRSGKIKGSKQGGKWMISIDQLPQPAGSSTEVKEAKPSGAKIENTPPVAADKNIDSKVYSIEEFSAMTYLTPFGVERFLKEGRLSGCRNASGQWQVDGSNLERGYIQKLVRK